ncbi:hypothetical protein ACWGLF_39890 [Streptomyces puniciscabiei]
MKSAPQDTAHRRSRPLRPIRLCWAFSHPLRLLKRYGFGCFQFALLAAAALLPLLLLTDLHALASLLRP